MVRSYVRCDDPEQRRSYDVTDRLKKIALAVAALAALALGGSALAGAASGGKDSGSHEQSEAAEGPERDEGGRDDADEASEEGESEGSDRPVSAEIAARARDAAASETRGKPGSVERDNEKGATYEVEVTTPDGKQADVRLDDRFEVVGVDEDNEDEGKEDEGKE